MTKAVIFCYAPRQSSRTRWFKLTRWTLGLINYDSLSVLWKLEISHLITEAGLKINIITIPSKYKSRSIGYIISISMFKASSTRRAPYKIPAQYKIQLREEIKPEIQPCSHSSGESERMVGFWGLPSAHLEMVKWTFSRLKASDL